MTKPLRKLLIFGFISLLIYGCSSATTTLDKRQLTPYLKAIAAAQHLRDSLGFTPIADSAKIILEGKGHNYDAMLHITQQNSSKNIAFKQHGKTFEWIGEQETFSGPRYIKTTEGEIKESITLSYQKVTYMPLSPNYLTAVYNTPDSTRGASKISRMPNIMPEREAKALIKEWAKSN